MLGKYAVIREKRIEVGHECGYDSKRVGAAAKVGGSGEVTLILNLVEGFNQLCLTNDINNYLIFIEF